MVNKVILLGNLGKDPVIRNTESGKKVASFSIATSEQKDKTTWHNVTLFDKLAELAEKYLKKGSSVYLEGRINYRKHEEKYYTDIVCNQMKFVGKKSDSQGSQNAPIPEQGNEPIDSSGDIPF